MVKIILPSCTGAFSTTAPLAHHLDVILDDADGDLGVRLLSALEAYRRLHFVAFGDELRRLRREPLGVAHVDGGGEPHFLELHYALVLALLFLALLLIVAVLAVVHQLASGGGDVGRRNLADVQPLFFRDPPRFGNGNDAELSAVLADKPDLAVTNPLVDD